MVKLLGAVLLLAGGGLMGFYAGEPLRNQSRLLGELSAGLALLEQELELGGLPLGPMLERTAGRTPGRAGTLFALCVESLGRQDRPEFSLIWRGALDSLPETDGEIRDILSGLGEILGRSSAAEQREAVCRVRRRLEEKKEQTDRQRPARDRLYRTLGLSGGALAAIFLL